MSERDLREVHDAIRAAAAAPDDVTQQLRAAYACDREGDELAAIDFYDAAWQLGVPGAERRDFLVGYGSTLRNVGRVDEAIAVLETGVAEFADFAPLYAFLSLALYTAHRHRESMSVALTAMLKAAEASGSLAPYDRALHEYRDLLRARSVATP